MVGMAEMGAPIILEGWQSIWIVGVSACVIFILHQKIQKMVKCTFCYQLSRVVLDKVQRAVKCVCGGRAQCCVGAETDLCLMLMLVMPRHQLALCESEKEGSLCEVQATPCWYSLSLSRPTCYLHEAPR